MATGFLCKHRNYCPLCPLLIQQSDKMCKFQTCQKADLPSQSCSNTMRKRENCRSTLATWRRWLGGYSAYLPNTTRLSAHRMSEEVQKPTSFVYPLLVPTETSQSLSRPPRSLPEPGCQNRPIGLKMRYAEACRWWWLCCSSLVRYFASNSETQYHTTMRLAIIVHPQAILARCKTRLQILCFSSKWIKHPPCEEHETWETTNLVWNCMRSHTCDMCNYDCGISEKKEQPCPTVKASWKRTQGIYLPKFLRNY